MNGGVKQRIEKYSNFIEIGVLNIENMTSLRI